MTHIVLCEPLPDGTQVFGFVSLWPKKMNRVRNAQVSDTTEAK